MVFSIPQGLRIMFIGVLLVITWLILLLRYPAKALPVSLAAALGLGLVAIWVVWLDNREVKQLARLELRISYAPEQCPADRPLLLKMNNGNNVPLTELRTIDALEGMPLLAKGSRLSISPVTAGQWRAIVTVMRGT